MTSRRLLIFQEARNPQNPSELIYLPVNKLGLPICGPGPELPSILELPLRILRAFTEIFNQPKFKGWYVPVPVYRMRLVYAGEGYMGLYANDYGWCRAIISAGPYHDVSEEGKYYAVLLEQVRDGLNSSGGPRDSVASLAG